MFAAVLASLPQKRLQLRVSGRIPVDEGIDGFMTETDAMMLLQEATHLFRAQVATKGLPDVLDNVQLYLSRRNDRLQRFWQPSEPIQTGDKTIVDSSVLKVREDGQPKLCAFGLTDLQP